MRSNIVALGLGSNLDRPVDSLRLALEEIKKIDDVKVIKASSIYESNAQLPENANESWNLKYLNAVILCEVSHYLKPHELLYAIKNIEIKMGRLKSQKWAPRTIDIDLLYWEDLHLHNKDLTLPHPHMHERPFVLLPLIEVYPEVELTTRPHWLNAWVSEKPFNTIKSKNYFWPRLVGILNITADSFSDGGQFLNPESLLLQAEKMLAAGAEILDVGAESTRPQATPVTTEVEFKNLNWSLDLIRDLKKKYSFKISLDCRHGEVVRQVLNSHRIDFLNDVSSFNADEMKTILKESKLNAFVMHSLSVPARPDNCFDDSENPVIHLVDWWIKKRNELLSFGIPEERLVFDPGIGFGKTKYQSLYILKNLEEFSKIKSPVMVGHSRKSFQTLFANKEASERDLATALVTKDLNLAYTNFLRVHDIESQKTALRY
jgi:2-amino-4-hydroxy-6-hydroxymethyldihydropteridine diphosphokinase / dihydropteroate synthase